MVSFLIFQRFHLGTVIAPVITPCFHRHCKIIRTAESRNKQRYQKRHHVFYFLDQISVFKICTSRDLCLHDLVRFFQKNRNKTKRNRHHHCNLMYRDMDLIQWTKAFFQSVGQLIRSSRQCHKRRADYQIDQSDCHADRHGNTFFCDLEDSKSNDCLTRCKKNIKHHRDQQDHKDCFQSLKDKLHRNCGNQDHSCQKYGCYRISDYSMK